jgi:hypothetical protein
MPSVSHRLKSRKDLFEREVAGGAEEHTGIGLKRI